MGFVYDYQQLRLDAASMGIDGKTLARRAGVSDQTVSRFFRGQEISPKTAKKLADAIGRSLKRYTPVSPEAVTR